MPQSGDYDKPSCVLGVKCPHPTRHFQTTERSVFKERTVLIDSCVEFFALFPHVFCWLSWHHLGFSNFSFSEPCKQRKAEEIGARVPVDQRTSFANDSAFHSWILWILRRWPHSWRRSHCLHVSQGKFPKLTLSNPELVPQWFSHILQEV